MSDVRLLHGDCLERMREMEASSVDAIATDPPYGIGFLGRDWDHGVPGVPFWAEALRVARPGAHLVAFGGTRTHHRLTCAIEDAGWEIRDGLVWLYGQGMPKSLDIGKAMDKAARAEREIVGLSPHSANRRAGTFARGNDRPSGYSCGNEGPRTVTAPATDLAKQWDGWGTGLKPSHEPIVLARKPLEGTVARNVAEHGCGGLNIDGCRIEAAAGDYNHSCNDYARPSNGSFERWSAGKRPPSSSGRWPANAILGHTVECREVGVRKVKGGTAYEPQPKEMNRAIYGKTNTLGRECGYTDPDGTETVIAWECSPDCPVAMLDAQAGERAGDRPNRKPRVGDRAAMGYKRDFGEGEFSTRGFADRGGASRFFYCPKSSPSERGPGNVHPTVKPLALMRWLVRLITPPGGLVLDPFCGSGSTGLACVEEGMRFTGIDLSAEYLAMARARLDAHRSAMPLLAGGVA
jgi:hypothetical protein